MSTQPNEVDPGGFTMTGLDREKKITLKTSTSGGTGLSLEYDLLTIPKTFVITPGGVSWTDGSSTNTTSLPRLALMQNLLQALEEPSGSTILRVKDTIRVNNLTNVGEFKINGLNTQIDATGDLILNPIGSIDANGKVLNMTGGEIHNCTLIHSQNNIDIDIEARGTGDIKFITNNVTRMTVADSGVTTFTQIPEVNILPSTNYQLTNKQYVDSKVVSDTYYYDDMWGVSGEGPLVFRITGTPSGASPSIELPEDGHNGIIQVANSAANTVAGYEMRSAIMFRNLLTNGNPFTIIFRPWPTGTTTNTTIKAGLAGTVGTSAPANGLFWRYSTNIAPTGVWNLVQDNVSLYSIPVPNQYVNTWIKISFLKTSGNGYTASFTDMSSNTTYTYNGSGISISVPLYAGITVACVSGATNKYFDIDYCAFQLNSQH